MSLSFSRFIRNCIKATKFWQKNYLILREFDQFRWTVFKALLFALLGAFFEGFSVGLIASFLQVLTNPSEPPLQTGIHWLDVRLLATEASETLRVYWLSGLILVTIWFRTGIFFLATYYLQLSTFKLLDHLRKRIFEQFQHLSLSYFSESRSGELINTMTNEVNQLKDAFFALSVFIIRFLTLIAYILAMLFLSWQLSIFSLLLYGLLSVMIRSIVGRLREASFAIPNANAQLASIALEFINGIRTVKASATEKFEAERFDLASNQVLRANAKVAKLSSSVKPTVEGFASTILIVMIVMAYSLFIARGELQSASLLAFMFVLFRLMPIVTQINGTWEQFTRSHGSLNQIKQLIRTDDKVYLENGLRKFFYLKQSIEFVDVDFGYADDELILSNVTLSIPRGKTTALVGASGAGKSTLVDLIPRFYDPSMGMVLIDGVDLREFCLESLRRKMGIVSQDTFIFNTSVRDNIAYGLENVSELAIHRAARQANAWEFIKKLPEGLDTLLGDRGVRLSGGQRQRIAIARALLRNPEILILDEATSALDSVTERSIQASLEKLSQGRTVIVIAHRLSTIMRADQVVVLEQGQIVEQGNYQELLEQRGKLWNYHQMQHQTQEQLVGEGI